MATYREIKKPGIVETNHRICGEQILALEMNERHSLGIILKVKSSATVSEIACLLSRCAFRSASGLTLSLMALSH